MNRPDCIIVHHTGGTDANPLADTSNHTFEGVNEWHRKQFNFKSSLGYYLGYHYFIDKAGKVTKARNHADVGAHTIGKNTTSIGICLAGNFDATMPTEAQIQALTKLMRSLCVSLAIPTTRIYPHRKFANKTCYGKNLKDTWAQDLLKANTQDLNAAVIENLRAQIAHLQALIDEFVAQHK